MADRIVDSHVHVVSDDPVRYPLRPSVATNTWYLDHPCSGPRLRELMDEGGVAAAVLVQGVGAYEYDNSYALATARAAPGVFTAVVCTDRRVDDPVGPVRSLLDAGARGYRWFCVNDDPRVGEPRALWSALAEWGVPVVPTFMPDGLEPFLPVAAAHRGIPFALDHVAFVDFGAGIPESLRALAAFPNVSLKVSTHALHTVAAHGDPADAVAELAAAFGGRLLWGSDWSQTHHAPYPDIVEEGRRAAAKLSDADRAAYLGGTATDLWPELT